MGRRVVMDQQAGFAGGLNIASDPAFLRPDQGRLMTNIRLSNYGAALKRMGTALVATTAITTFDYQNANGPSGIYWPKNSFVYVCAPGTATTALHLWRTFYNFPSAATWTDLGAILQYRPVVFSDGTNEVMYFAGTNGGGRVQKYDGTTITTLASPTPVALAGLCVYNDRLWGWLGNTLYYSNLSSATSSTGGDSIGDTTAGGGSIIVRTFGASNIYACAAVNGSLLIWHQQGISVLTGWGQDDVQVQPQVLNASVGLGPNGSLDYVAVANELTEGDTAYFLTPLGMYVTNGGYVRPLATPDRPDPIAYSMQTSGLTFASGSVVFNGRANEVWVGEYGTGMYVYNVVLQAWSGPFTGAIAGSNRKEAFFQVVSGTGLPRLWKISRDADAGTSVIECDSMLGGSTPTYKDNVTPNGSTTGTGGTAVTATLQPHRLFCGDRSNAKTFRWLNLLATLTTGATAPTVACSTPIGGSSTLTLTNLTSVETPYYLSPGGQGAYLDATITDVGTSGQSQYVMATVEANFLGQR